MDDTAKYLIHAKLTADGVVERSDVVGAVFGQTEGLLGDEMDLRDLQQSSKVGRIDVEVESEGGQSFGEITIASSLDKPETAVLAASLETITRVGPCQARVETTGIEDVRAAKRRIVVQRAKELLAESFEEGIMDSEEILTEVKESARVDDIDEYDGLPAGPAVSDSDAIVVVEGRADVLRLLKYGIKNAIAVEGTNVPDAVADLTAERTVTAFLDGDRGGELILRELAQVGDVDYVAFAPEGRSVEDLDRETVFAALREKTAYDRYVQARDEGDAESARAIAATDGSARPPPDVETPPTEIVDTPEDEPHPRTGSSATTESSADPSPGRGTEGTEPTDRVTGADENPVATPDVPESLAAAVEDRDGTDASDETPTDQDAEATPTSAEIEPTVPDLEADATSTAVEPESEPVGDGQADDTGAESTDQPASLASHVREVVGEETGRARLLSESFETLAEVDADDAFDAIEDREEAPFALVVDGTVDQRLLDIAAQRGVEQAVGRETGAFVKQPVTPRVRDADGFLA